MGTTPMIDVFGVSLASRSRSATSRSISSLRLRHTQLLLRGGARTPLEPLEPPRCSAADGDLKKRGDVEQPKTERWKNFLVDHLTLESQESIVFSKEQREGPFLKKTLPGKRWHFDPQGPRVFGAPLCQTKPSCDDTFWIPQKAPGTGLGPG